MGGVASDAVAGTPTILDSPLLGKAEPVGRESLIRVRRQRMDANRIDTPSTSASKNAMLGLERKGSAAVATASTRCRYAIRMASEKKAERSTDRGASEAYHEAGVIPASRLARLEHIWKVDSSCSGIGIVPRPMDYASRFGVLTTQRARTASNRVAASCELANRRLGYTKANAMQPPLGPAAARKTPHLFSPLKPGRLSRSQPPAMTHRT